MNLIEFKNGLLEELKAFEKPRPFVCDGNPLDCKIFIVGINAATEMQDGFWDFWSDLDGFNKTKWLDYYIKERQEPSLKQYKRRRNKLSNTRQRIEWIVKALKPFNALETNLFVKAAPTVSELKPADKESNVFNYLFTTIKPSIIFIHGNVAIKYFEEKYNIIINKNGITNISMKGLEVMIVGRSHLSRGWSEEKTLDLAEFLKSKI